MKALSSNHWTAREFPTLILLTAVREDPHSEVTALGEGTNWGRPASGRQEWGGRAESGQGTTLVS